MVCMVLATAELREGYLMKRGRDNGQYLSRRFVLTEKEGTLKYYTKEDVSHRFLTQKQLSV